MFECPKFNHIRPGLAQAGTRTLWYHADLV